LQYYEYNINILTNNKITLNTNKTTLKFFCNTTTIFYYLLLELFMFCIDFYVPIKLDMNDL